MRTALSHLVTASSASILKNTKIIYLHVISGKKITIYLQQNMFQKKRNKFFYESKFTNNLTNL